jgi:neutral ceramidase
MAGYGARTHPSEGVRQPLFVKVLALEDQTGAKSVMVTSDLLGFPRVVAEPIARECHTKLGLSRERLALNSSHTHSGPVIGDMLRPAYPAMTAQQQEVIKRYTGELIVRVVETVSTAMANLEPASLAFGQGEAGFGVNRRRVTLRQLPGPVDPDVPVLSVRDAGGQLRAVLFGYACHNTTLGDYQINGDWAGFAQAQLEQNYPGGIALYVQGCGADINPLPRYQGNDPQLQAYSVELARNYGKIAAVAVDLVLHTKMKTVAGPVRAAYSLVDVPFHNVPSRQELETRVQDESAGGAAERRWAQYMLDRMAREGKLPDRYPYPVQVWQFWRDLKLIVMGGEVVVDYSLRLKREYGWNDTWVAGYSNDVFAYIPSLRVLHEGGYEGGGAMIPYGQPAPFGAAVEEIIIEKIADLMRKTAD